MPGPVTDVLRATDVVRRGACPTVRRPLEAADGLLVRVRLAAGVLTVDQARRVAEAARRRGNGVVELTSRANLQVRGVRPEALDALADDLAAAGLAARRPEDEPQADVLVPATAGLDPTEPADPRPLAARLSARLTAGALGGRRLHPKACVAVDGGGTLGPPPGPTVADVTLTIARAPDGTLTHTLHLAPAAPPPHDADAAAGPRPPAHHPDAGITPAPAPPAVDAGVTAPHTGSPALNTDAAVDTAGLVALDTGVTGVTAPHAGSAALDTDTDVAGSLAGVTRAPATPPALDTGAAVDTAGSLPGRTRAPATQLPIPAGFIGSHARAVALDADAAVDAAVAVLTHAADHPTGPRRVRDVVGPATAPVAGGLAVPRAARSLLGIVRGAGPSGEGAGVAVAVGALPPLGRLDADRLDALARVLDRHGAGELRVTTGRGVLVPLAPVAPMAPGAVAPETERADRAAALAGELAELGFVVDPDDPAAGVVACAGLPGCSSGHADTRADGAAVVEALRRAGGPARTVHLSGCAKRCASRHPHDLTLVAEPAGYAVVLPATTPPAPAPVDGDAAPSERQAGQDGTPADTPGASGSRTPDDIAGAPPNTRPTDRPPRPAGSTPASAGGATAGTDGTDGTDEPGTSPNQRPAAPAGNGTDDPRTSPNQHPADHPPGSAGSSADGAGVSGAGPDERLAGRGLTLAEALAVAGIGLDGGVAHRGARHHAGAARPPTPSEDP